MKKKILITSLVFLFSLGFAYIGCAAISFELHLHGNLSHPMFNFESATGVCGLPDPIHKLETTPKYCWVKSEVSHEYEGPGAWSKHYVRAYLGDNRVGDTRRVKCEIIKKGRRSGWYGAKAVAYGQKCDGTGYTFYGKDINNP